MKEPEKLGQKRMSKVNLHFVWGQLSREEKVTPAKLCREIGSPYSDRKQIGANYYLSFLKFTFLAHFHNYVLFFAGADWCDPGILPVLQPGDALQDEEGR